MEINLALNTSQWKSHKRGKFELFGELRKGYWKS